MTRFLTGSSNMERRFDKSNGCGRIFVVGTGVETGNEVGVKSRISAGFLSLS